MRCIQFALFFCIAHSVFGITVDAPYGTVSGVESNSRFAFLGIPFAEPPVGELRFKAPVPWSIPSEGYVQDATSLRSPCMQGDSGLLPLPSEPSEDCLHLNIFTPTSDDLSQESLPVLIWIHGGSFTGGSAVLSLYDGSILAATEEVIVVTINYRVGALGFMVSPELCEESPTCGMNGILDQQLAMSWVQDNIAAFGGDPDNVTIFGESAGAISVVVQMVLESAEGLFHKAIIQSGVTEGFVSQETAAGYGESVKEIVACSGTGTEALTCLRNVPAEDIVSAQSLCSGNCWWPSLSEYNGFEKQPLSLLFAGEYNQVPFMMGCNSNEGFLFALPYFPITEAKYNLLLQASWGLYADVIAEQYPVPEEYESFFEATEAIIADSNFVNHLCYVQDAIMSGNTIDPTAYFYLFDHSPSFGSELAGAFHGAEIPFVFGAPNGDDTFTEEEEILAANMGKLWATFAATGNPNPSEGESVWPLFDEESHLRIVFDTLDTSPIEEYRSEACEFWKIFSEPYPQPFLMEQTEAWSVYYPACVRWNPDQIPLAIIPELCLQDMDDLGNEIMIGTNVPNSGQFNIDIVFGISPGNIRVVAKTLLGEIFTSTVVFTLNSPQIVTEKACEDRE